ncbi:MAG: flagellar biosynthesis protein FlhB [Proteobacteria bacterium]|nr:flagellar biosynthesis protein FlhB [Pseudomonadota bacterium]
MADEETTDESQKTEDPTARRLEEAHERGQVVNSREVNNWVILFTATIVVAMGGPGIMSDIQNLFKNFLEQAYAIPMDSVGLGRVLKLLFLRIGGDIILPLLLLSFAGAFSGFMQTGPLFTLEPLRPDLSKISIFQGFGRLFSKRSLMELGKGLIKIALVTIAAVMALQPYFDNVEHFVGLDFSQALFELKALFLRMMIAVLSILFILAVLDYIFQRSEFMKTMRMSKQEIREEHKQTEGDPHVKSKLRQLREQKARQRMMQAVPTADVVITNPTHYAVALKYNSLEMDAPTMVAKGIDSLAERIKAVAKEHNIPVVENATLSRALYSSMEIDQTIPREHYKAVAEVISYVFKLKGRRT